MAATRSHRPVAADIGGRDRPFKGLSDRAVPVQLSRLESPDLLNVEFAGRMMEKRRGYKRLHANRLRNASIRLDGLKDHYRITNITAYQVALSSAPYIACSVVMREFPSSARALFSMGYGGTANQSWLLYFDPALGAGAGGFSALLWDGGGGAARVATVTDATACNGDEYRALEAYVDVADGKWTLRVWKADGTVTQAKAASALVGPGVTSTEDILIGANHSAAGVVDTASFVRCTIAECRYFVGAPSAANNCRMTTTNKWYIREIEDSNVSLFTGYWKCNDGNTVGTLADSTTTANAAIPPEEAVAWSTDQAKISGQSGLSFLGKAAWIHLKDNTPGGAALNSVFIPTTGNYGNFSVRFLFTPVLPTGATAAPNQCILWAGHTPGTTNLPQPVGLSVVNDKFVMSYDDNGALKTSTLSVVNVSALAGKKLRVALNRYTDVIYMQVMHLNANGTATGYASTPTACTGTTASAVATNWSIMQHMSAWGQTAGTGGILGTFGTPFTTNLSIAGEAAHTHGAGLGFLDDFQIVHCNHPSVSQNVGLGALTSLGFAAIYQEITNWQAWYPFASTIIHAKMNEGHGNILGTINQPSAVFSMTVYPQLGRTIRWDIGIVDPYHDPPGQTIEPYDRYQGDQSSGTAPRLKDVICISGSTMYRIDETANVAIPIGAGIFQGGQWSASRYGNDLLFACANGKRPLRYNGSTLDFLGIEAPLNPLQVVTKAAGGTFIPAQTYSFFCTFRNKSNGDESNPSPIETVTFAALNNTIDSLNVPISSDPQVNQRRIWMIPPPGTYGAVAYLLLSIDDNVTTQWTQDITTPVFVGTSMEYLTNQEAPQGSVVEVHKDIAFVGGNQITPTRWFFSVAGRVSSWDHDIRFVDLDLDTGDPIVAAAKQLNNLFVSIRDGWARVTPTGDTNVPVAFSFTRRDHGATGPSAVVLANDLIYYLSERDVYASDGFNEINISSPEDDPRARQPSIQETMTTGLNDAKRHMASCVYNRSKKQVWIACASADSDTNDQILVFDITQRIWSKYDIPASTLADVDDDNDQSRVYGIVRGFVCRLDEPLYFDGVLTPIVGIATSGSTTTFVDSTAPFTGLTLRGLTAHVYDVSGRYLYEAVIYDNTSTTLTFYSAIGAAVDAGDYVAIGGYRWYADFVADFGDPSTEKRLKLLRLIGSSSSNLHSLVISIKPTNNAQRTWSLDGSQTIAAKWDPAARKRAFSVGGQGTSFRIRIQDSTIIDARPDQCPPNVLGRFAISSFVLDAEELGHVV